MRWKPPPSHSESTEIQWRDDNAVGNADNIGVEKINFQKIFRIPICNLQHFVHFQKIFLEGNAKVTQYRHCIR